MSAGTRAPRTLLAASTVLLAVALACSGGEASSGGGDGDAGAGSEVCVPGSTMLCVGPGACQGAEVCLADGSGYGPCDCGGANGGTTGAGGSTANGGSGVGGVSGQGGASGTTATGGTSATGGSGGLVDPRFQGICLKGCATTAECGTGTPADGPSNYSCPDGACHPIGCQNDAECNAQRAGSVCRPSPGVTFKICGLPCTTAANCGDTSELNGSDNFSCPDGACIWMGCHTDAECQTTLQRPASRCVDGIPRPNCVDVCQTAADCALPTTPPPGAVANYRCDNGSCYWVGCLSDADCSYLPGFVCRPFIP